MNNRLIFWVDEEETVAYPDIMHLKYLGFKVELVGSAGAALDWFYKNRANVLSYESFVIDVQLPINGDIRFSDQIPSQGAFTGLKLCEIIRDNLSNEWKQIKYKTTLYTRLPETPRIEKIKSFAIANDVHFIDKSNNVSVAMHLFDTGILAK